MIGLDRMAGIALALEKGGGVGEFVRRVRLGRVGYLR